MQWISCEERLPPLDVRVLVAKWDGREKSQMFFTMIARRFGKHQWQEDNDEEIMGSKYGVVTHWMPIPDDPDICTLKNHSGDNNV